MRGVLAALLAFWLGAAAWLVFRPLEPAEPPQLPWMEVNPTVSFDGDMVAFEASRNTTGPAFGRQHTGATDVVVVDRRTGAVKRLVMDGRSCRSPWLSGDGHRLVFEASDGPIHLSEVFLASTRDLEYQKVPAPWTSGGHGSCFLPTISEDGESMSFIAHRPVRKIRAAWDPLIVVAELPETGLELAGWKSPKLTVPISNRRIFTPSGAVALSPDGRRIAWEHRSMRNEVDLDIRLIAARDGKDPRTLHHDGGEPSLSSDRCAFVAPDADDVYQIMLYDFTTGEKRFVTGGNDDSLEPSISGDGRHVAFTSYASDLVEGDTNEVSDVFLLEVESGEISMVSRGGDGSSFNPALSGDGSTVVFASVAESLVEGGLPGQVYVWERGWERCRVLPVR